MRREKGWGLNSSILRRSQLRDQRAQLGERVRGHCLQAIQLFGDARRLTVEQEAGGLRSQRDAEDRLAD